MASVAVRIDETLYSLAKAEAKRQHRSISKQIELWLTKGAMQTTAEDEGQKTQWRDNGFIGCCEVEPDFASSYKEKINWQYKV